MPGSAPEEVTPPSEDDAPTNINPAPSVTPEGESTEGSEDDAPTNINPMPGTIPDSDSPTNMNKPGETSLPDSDSPSSTEEKTPSEGGAEILAPQ